jgi:hypothetical protein
VLIEPQMSDEGEGSRKDHFKAFLIISYTIAAFGMLAPFIVPLVLPDSLLSGSTQYIIADIIFKLPVALWALIFIIGLFICKWRGLWLVFGAPIVSIWWFYFWGCMSIWPRICF